MSGGFLAAMFFLAHGGGSSASEHWLVQNGEGTRDAEGGCEVTVFFFGISCSFFSTSPCLLNKRSISTDLTSRLNRPWCPVKRLSVMILGSCAAGTTLGSEGTLLEGQGQLLWQHMCKCAMSVLLGCWQRWWFDLEAFFAQPLRWFLCLWLLSLLILTWPRVLPQSIEGLLSAVILFDGQHFLSATFDCLIKASEAPFLSEEVLKHVRFMLRGGSLQRRVWETEIKETSSQSSLRQTIYIYFLANQYPMKCFVFRFNR